MNVASVKGYARMKWKVKFVHFLFVDSVSMARISKEQNRVVCKTCYLGIIGGKGASG